MTAAIVYPNCNPASVQPNSTVAVVGGILGYINVTLLPPNVTQITVRLDVFDSASGTASASRSFSISTTAIEITNVAGLIVVEGVDPFQNTTTRKLVKTTNNANVAVREKSVGGAFSLTGSAYTVGCTRILRSFTLARFDAPASAPAPQPASASAVGGTALFPAVQPVVYDETAAHPWNSGCFIDTPNVILNGYLTSQWDVVHCVPPLPFLPYDEPKVKPIPFWNSGALNGRFVLLLDVQDQAVPVTPAGTSVALAGVDGVVVWIDNRQPIAQITSIGGLEPCADLALSEFVGTTAEIRGVAWDPPIDATAPQQQPNDNFGSYGLSFQKNGGGGTGIAAATPNTRVPNIWPNAPASGVDGVLSNWDIVAALDAGPAPDPSASAPNGQLYRGERCAYVFTLSVSDTTQVGDGGGSHSALALYAITIINDIP